jgi:hypothetical protein
MSRDLADVGIMQDKIAKMALSSVSINKFSWCLIHNAHLVKILFLKNKDLKITHLKENLWLFSFNIYFCILDPQKLKLVHLSLCHTIVCIMQYKISKTCVKKKQVSFVNEASDF